MSIGTNDSAVKLGTRVVLESSGSGGISNGTLASASNAYDAVADGASAPDGIFALSVGYSTAPTESTTIDLYAQPLDVDGTSGHDSPAPTSTYRQKFIGSFVVRNASGWQYLELQARDLPRNAVYYLHNLTGQTINIGWALSVVPATLGPI